MESATTTTRGSALEAPRLEPRPPSSDAPAEPRPERRRRGVGSLIATGRDYLALTKPRIIALLLVTTVATMVAAEPTGLDLTTVLWTALGGYLAAGGAGAINHYVDRDR